MVTSDAMVDGGTMHLITLKPTEDYAQKPNILTLLLMVFVNQAHAAQNMIQSLVILLQQAMMKLHY